MTAAELLDEAVALLKATTVGYANHGTAWQNNETTKWWQGLDKISQAKEALGPPPVRSGGLPLLLGLPLAEEPS